MVAKVYLNKLGYQVARAFMSLTGLANPSSENSMASTKEYIAMSKACESLRHKWIRMAPASVVANDDRNFAILMGELLLSVNGNQDAAYFRVVEYRAAQPVPELDGRTLVIATSELEFDYAKTDCYRK